MALNANALCTPAEVAEWLVIRDSEASDFSVLFERMINSASQMLERLLNRGIKSQTYTDVTQNGTGRRYIYLENTPVITLTAVTVYDWDFSNSDIIDVTLPPASGAPEIALSKDSGRLVLLPDAPISVFTKGEENVFLTYTAGFQTDELEPFKDACLELIATKWHAMGGDPRLQSRSDTQTQTVTVSRADFNRLSQQTQELIWAYRRGEV